MTDGLNERQRDVARLIAEGFPNKAIAAQLGTDVKTIYYHIARIAETWNLDPSRDTRVLIACRACRSLAA